MKQLQFLAIAKPMRDNWLATWTSEEKLAMSSHMEYVRRMFAEGKVVLSGPCLDGAYGIIIYKADSTEEAQQMYENDPLVQAGIVHTELHPFKVGVMESQ